MDTMNKGLIYELTYKDVVDIMKIIDESTCQELHLEIGDFKLDLVKGRPGAGPAANSSGNAGAAGGKVHAANQAAAVQAAAAPSVGIAGKKKEALPEAAVAQRKVSGDASSIEIITPLEGVFYRAPAPGAPPFVEAGSPVEAGDQVAIVEVMKLMNSIKAPRKGIIREILVQNETVVKMGQVLMILDPDPVTAEK
jgi:acetyl-CoA carboxylase biotin carboxyl carrier protein